MATDELDLEVSKKLETLEDYKEMFQHLKNDYSNEIPTEMIHGEMKDRSKRKYKVLTNWFTPLDATAYDMAMRGMVQDEELNNKIVDFHNMVTSSDFKNRDLTTPEQIRAGDDLINHILEYIEYDQSDGIAA